MMRCLALAMLLMLIGGAAQAQLTLCNRTAKPIEAAHTEENKTLLQVVGWKRIAPNACVPMATLVDHAYAYYAYAPGTDWEWVGDEDDGVEFCVQPDRSFRIDYDDVDEDYLDADEYACPPGAKKRRFTVIENDGRKHTIELD